MGKFILALRWRSNTPRKTKGIAESSAWKFPEGFQGRFYGGDAGEVLRNVKSRVADDPWEA